VRKEVRANGKAAGQAPFPLNVASVEYEDDGDYQHEDDGDSDDA